MADKCKVGRLRLTPADQALLAGWLEDGTDHRGRRVAADLMAQAITRGTDSAVSPTTLKDHRGGRCVCYRKADA